MARHLLSVLVTFLLFVCCACGLAYAGDTAQQRRIALFASGRTGGPEKNVRRFGPSFLLAADGVMVALAEAENLVGKRRGGGDTLARYINERGEDADAVARYIKQRRGAADIVARYIETEGRDWAEKTIEGGGANWKTQLPAPTRDEAGHSCFPWNPMAVAKGNKIYLLVVRHMRGDQDSQTESGCEFALVVGDVKPTSGGHGTDRAIEWQTPELPLPGLSKQFGDLLLKPLPFAGGSAFLTRGGEIVFVVGVRKENKYGSAILYAKDTDVTKWRVSFTPFFADCYYPSVFAWEEKLIALPTHCSGGGQKVQESADMGATWTEAVGPFSRLWDSLQENDGLTTATIDNKTVLLSTHLREKNKRGNTRREYEICLRLADGNRVHDIGPIVTDSNLVASSGLVYANGELFFLHQGGTMAPRSIFLTRLDGELESIRAVLRTWAENDAHLSKPRHAVTARSQCEREENVR